VPVTDDVSYCHTWNRRRMRPGVPLTPAEARARHDAGEQYVAVLPGPPPVLVTVDGAGSTIAVTFYDRLDRQVLKYWFKASSPPAEQFFLRNVTFWEYPDERRGLVQGDASRIEDLAYQEDGYVMRIVRDKVAQEKTTQEFRDVPVAGNWEPVPRFGEYTSIARRERPRAGQG
jgi:hypothetical protein